MEVFFIGKETWIHVRSISFIHFYLRTTFTMYGHYNLSGAVCIHITSSHIYSTLKAITKYFKLFNNSTIRIVIVNLHPGITILLNSCDHFIGRVCIYVTSCYTDTTLGI